MDTMNMPLVAELPAQPNWFTMLKARFTRLFRTPHEHACLRQIGEECDC